MRDDEGTEDALLTVGLLAGGTGFKGTVERRLADFAAPVVPKDELEREREARAEGGPETDVGRLVIERAGPVDIFDEDNKAIKLGGTCCTARYTPFGGNKLSSNEVDNRVVVRRLVVEVEPWT